MDYVLKNEKGLCLCYDGGFREITLNNTQGGQSDVVIYGCYEEAKNDRYGTEQIEEFK